MKDKEDLEKLKELKVGHHLLTIMSLEKESCNVEGLAIQTSLSNKALISLLRVLLEQLKEGDDVLIEEEKDKEKRVKIKVE